MATMRAARFDTTTRELTVRDVAIPRPGPGEALVKVAACGICHSDLSMMHGAIPVALPEITPGHEASGEIAELGSAAEGWRVGDRVLLAAFRACGTCSACIGVGALDDCLEPQVMAFAYDGAWAEYVVVPIAALTRVPDGIPMEQAAILADAVSTPYAAVVETGAVRPAESVGIWGLGGVGTHLVQIARLAGAAPIIALDPLASARERALRLGADHALDPTAEGTVEEIRRLTGGRGLDAAFDVVARSSTMAQADAALAHRGRLVLVGVTPDPVDLGPVGAFVTNRHTVSGHLGYRKRHLEELVTLVAHGRLDVSGSVSAVLPLEQIAEGVGRLERHEGNPVRIVVKPGAAG
ncbi:zinc-binding dehydrogenase [Streptomyces sp. NPDC054933]